MVLSLVLAVLQQPTQTPQTPTPLPAARADTSPFRRLDLPTPTLLREGSGRPGPRYWQQRVDYTISVALDTATHTIAITMKSEELVNDRSVSPMRIGIRVLI